MFTLSVELDKSSESKVRLRLENIPQNMRKVLRGGINASVIYVASLIKNSYLSGSPVHVRKGNLRRAIFSKMADDLTGVVGVGKEAPYAAAVNYGSRPHVIRAKNGRALAIPNAFGYGVGLNLRREAAQHLGLGVGSAGAWRYAYQQASSSGWGGLNLSKMLFLRQVNHPGTQPTMFMQNALKASVPKVREIIEGRIAKLVKGSGGE